MTDDEQGNVPAGIPVGVTRPAFTLIHVLWLVSAGGVTWIVYGALRGMATPARITIAIIALALAIAVTHLLVVFIVTAVVIPRLKPGSAWSREVDSYMASVFPGRW